MSSHVKNHFDKSADDESQLSVSESVIQVCAKWAFHDQWLAHKVRTLCTSAGFFTTISRDVTRHDTTRHTPTTKTTTTSVALAQGV